jgi:hypothetical protein
LEGEGGGELEAARQAAAAQQAAEAAAAANAPPGEIAWPLESEEGEGGPVMPLGGYIGWECQYAAEMEQEVRGCSGVLASTADFNDFAHLVKKAFNEATEAVRKACHAKRCKVVSKPDAGAKVGLLKVTNNKDPHDGGDAELGCFIGGTVGGTFAAMSSLGLATEGGAIGGCFIVGGVVAAIFE